MENEKRLIDANKRIEEIKLAHCADCENYGGVKCRACWVDDAISLIEDAHTVDAVEVVHGRWESKCTHGDFEEKRCSACNGFLLVRWYDRTMEYNYCPNCGAKMDGGIDDG